MNIQMTKRILYLYHYQSSVQLVENLHSRLRKKLNSIYEIYLSIHEDGRIRKKKKRGNVLEKNARDR